MLKTYRLPGTFILSSQQWVFCIVFLNFENKSHPHLQGVDMGNNYLVPTWDTALRIPSNSPGGYSVYSIQVWYYTRPSPQILQTNHAYHLDFSQGLLSIVDFPLLVCILLGSDFSIFIFMYLSHLPFSPSDRELQHYCTYRHLVRYDCGLFQHPPLSISS